MKNIVSLDTKVKCCYCKQQGFFCSSIDEYSCPRCDHLEIWDDIYKTFKDDDIRCDNYEPEFKDTVIPFNKRFGRHA
jgi:hypothetical protein